MLDLMQGAHSALSHTHRSDTRHTEANILLQVLGVVSIGAQTGINESESVEINHGRIKMSLAAASFLRMSCGSYVQLLIKIWLKHAKILDQKASSIWAI